MVSQRDEGIVEGSLLHAQFGGDDAVASQDSGYRVEEIVCPGYQHMCAAALHGMYLRKAGQEVVIEGRGWTEPDTLHSARLRYQIGRTVKSHDPASVDHGNPVTQFCRFLHQVC